MNDKDAHKMYRAYSLLKKAVELLGEVDDSLNAEKNEDLQWLYNRRVVYNAHRQAQQAVQTLKVGSVKNWIEPPHRNDNND
jgi:hypothetical protein